MSSSIILLNPKYAHNIGSVVRAAAAFDAEKVLWTGDRVNFEQPNGKLRLPREERLREYANVEWKQRNRPFDYFEGFTPVAVELKEGAEYLPDFVHPEKAVYVFGPEDGGIQRVDYLQCHRFVRIPSRHCLNLAAAVNLVLYDRLVKQSWDHSREQGG
jgi:tRNA(Leu) C34 or U34 (ribose-2'-O)-methylase TrmL